MNWFGNRCRRYRAKLSLLASGVLPESETAEVRAHLAVCPDCRKFHDEMKSLTAGLADWERHYTAIEPAPEVQLRWAKLVHDAARAKPVRRFAPEVIVINVWHELILPCRQVWAGLAAVWVLILVANVSMHDPSERIAAKSSPTPEMILAWRQQERLLAELIGPNVTRAAEPPKTFSPRPGTKSRAAILMT